TCSNTLWLPGVLQNFLAFLFGYFCGSIPFGLILTRAAGTADLRAIGSGNIGATNVLRTGRKDLAAMTLFLDLAKGAAAVWIAGSIGGPAAMLAAAPGALFRHLFPVLLKFKGRKGVASIFGLLLAWAWRRALAFGLIGLTVACLTRYSSAAALSASALTPLALLVAGESGAALVFGLMAVMLWERHRANIARLAAGTESRIGSS